MEEIPTFLSQWKVGEYGLFPVSSFGHTYLTFLKKRLVHWVVILNLLGKDNAIQLNPVDLVSCIQDWVYSRMAQGIGFEIKSQFPDLQGNWGQSHNGQPFSFTGWPLERDFSKNRDSFIPVVPYITGMKCHCTVKEKTWVHPMLANFLSSFLHSYAGRKGKRVVHAWKDL